MPHTTYGLLGAIRQHHIDSPKVGTGLATGRLNACNLCHLDRTLAWTEEHLRGWYGQPEVPLPAEARSVAAGVDLLLAGDAAQRALLAWHFGWGPAGEVSGTDWMGPLLARLLDDPYPAVRFIAYRSLRHQAEFASLDFDFVGEAASRRKVMNTVFDRAPRQVTGNAAKLEAVLRTVEGRLDETALERWVQRRNDRPVHLRE